MENIKLAVLYQATPPPIINNSVKPLKPGGYSDSGADIAFNLRNVVEVIAPVSHPQENFNMDWVFPDTESGLQHALSLGANTFWLNTVLFSSHPILKALKDAGIRVVGQHPDMVEKYDDKWITNNLLRKYTKNVVRGILFNKAELINLEQNQIPLDFPLIVKPVRGRGSDGVSLVTDFSQLKRVVNELLNQVVTINGKSVPKYGSTVIIEEYLSGTEITVTVMLPGDYIINNKKCIKNDYWTLPAVERFNHTNGVAPYNGVTAVVNNSKIVDLDVINSSKYKAIIKSCEIAANIIQAKAPIRIDCRANSEESNFFMFDLNMKPNMTGHGRNQRDDQDNLCSIAATAIGWDYRDLLINMLAQSWKL